jgi:multidrug efflux system membrane fusion protein
VDATTGTILVKAVFQNRGHHLWPGEFVRVLLRLGTRPGVLVVPGQAVQTGQNGSFVFVVKADQTVETRPVVAGMHVNGEIVIEKGVQPDEMVITERQLRLTAGSRVQVRDPGAP